MKLMSDALKIVTHEDAELAKKAPMRAWEQDFSTETDNDNLMGLLGEIDGLKQEIHERMRRVEAVKQAKSVLLEDAVRTEALNKRLTEIGKVMSAVHPVLLAAGKNNEDSDSFRAQTRELLAESEPDRASVRIVSDGLTLPWRRPEDSVDSSSDVPSEFSVDLGLGSISEASRVAFNAASQRLEEAEHEWREAWNRADEAAREAKRLFEESTARLNLAVTEEERAASEIRSAQDALTNGYQSASERLETAERFWKHADEGALEAKRLLEESTSRLDLAAIKEEQASAQLRSAKETLTTAYQSSNERLEEAERCWKQTDRVILEATRLFDQSTAQLDLARKREEAAAASLESVRQEFTKAYQSSTLRLEEAERVSQKGDQAAKEAQHLIDQATAELLQARSAEEKAAADLISARQELTTAYQFASVAAQRRLDSAEAFRKAGRWAVFAIGFSWVAMVWAVWVALRTAVPLWGPGVATVVVLLLVIGFERLGTREV
jgi:hypothetical protein